MKKTRIYSVDLTKIDGRGDFSCPKCEVTISPDDTKDVVYSILEPKLNNNGLEELVICCNKCKTQIHLSGFSILKEIDMKEEKFVKKRRISLLYSSLIKNLCRDQLNNSLKIKS